MYAAIKKGGIGVRDLICEGQLGFERKRRPLPIKFINRIVSSNLFVFVLAALTCIAFAYSREFEFYVFVIVYGLYVGLFNDDLAPLMPLFVFCYVAPSAGHNPGRTTESVFYGKSGTFLLCFVLIAVALIFVRIARDENMGFKRLFLKKRLMLPGMLLLGGSYICSGILWQGYSEYALRNIVFASIQFLSVFLLYFIFSATVDWHRFKINYFVCIGIALGLIVAYELVWVYTNLGVVKDGVIDRDVIMTGWGIRNNIGAMLVMALPFPFYFAARKLFPAPWILAGVGIFAFCLASCSRASALCAIGIFALSYIVLLVTARNKFGVYVITAIGLVVGAILAVKNFDAVSKFLATLPETFNASDVASIFDSNGRVELYKAGIKNIGTEPIFGMTFYPTNYDVYDVATLESFSSFFPPRWHNTLIQVTVSCGFVGLFAYIVHRISTVAVFLKRKNQVNAYIGISILSLLLMSLLDCHFFNVGPTLFYSMMLAVMEFGEEEI